MIALPRAAKEPEPALGMIVGIGPDHWAGQRERSKRDGSLDRWRSLSRACGRHVVITAATHHEGGRVAFRGVSSKREVALPAVLRGITENMERD